MAAWSSDLHVGGYYKIGYPGVLILEGESSSVQQYVTLLRSQRWKAMAVRGQQEVGAIAHVLLNFPVILLHHDYKVSAQVHCASSILDLRRKGKTASMPDDVQEEFSSAEDAEAARLLPKKLVELSEEQLGDMGEACREAGMESLFLLALKIDRSETSGNSCS